MVGIAPLAGNAFGMEFPQSEIVMVVETLAFTTTDSQVLVGSAMIALSVGASDLNAFVTVDLCYRDASTPTAEPILFNAPFSVFGNLHPNGFNIVTATGAISPESTGTWLTGVCVINQTGLALTADNVSGWIMVTN